MEEEEVVIADSITSMSTLTTLKDEETIPDLQAMIRIEVKKGISEQMNQLNHLLKEAKGTHDNQTKSSTETLVDISARTQNENAEFALTIINTMFESKEKIDLAVKHGSNRQYKRVKQVFWKNKGNDGCPYNNTTQIVWTCTQNFDGKGNIRLPLFCQCFLFARIKTTSTSTRTKQKVSASCERF